MKNKKQRVNVWLDPDIISKIDGLIKRFNVDNLTNSWRFNKNRIW